MENKVIGKILNENTRSGIADLLVILYDIDPVKVANNDMGGEDYVVSSDDQITPSEVDPTTPSDNNFTIEQALRDDAKTWVNFPGDRIGSVLTDIHGKFILEYDDQAFLVNAKEKRPDLVLMVLAPDRNQGSSVISRLLHYSYVPRQNSGRLESYIIHLTDLILQEKGVKKPPVTGPELQSYFHNLFLPDVVRRRNELREKSKLIPKWLLPRAFSSHPKFLPKTASKEEVKEVLENTIIEGIRSIALRTTVDEHGDTIEREVEMAPMAVYLSEAEYSRIVDNVSTCEALALKGLGTELVRVRDLLSEKKARDAKKLLEDLPHDPTTTEGTDDSDTTPIIDVAEGSDFVTSRILGQVAKLSTVEQGKTNGIIDDLKTIKDRINELEMSSGPANVTAFRDFHSLQIAFEYVWTAAFDNELESNIKNLYSQISELNEYYGVEIDRPEDDFDVYELEQLLLSINSEYLTDEEEVSASEIPELYRLQSVFNCNITRFQWMSINQEGRERLTVAMDPYIAAASEGGHVETLIETYRPLIQEVCEEVLSEENYLTKPNRLKKLIDDIGERLSQPYSFKYYEQYSVNYGILVNYRQEWRPKNYQVGRLMATLPLAPGESRELKVNHKTKLKRAEKEMRKSLVENSYETSSTVKSELDVLAKLSTDSNFKLSAQGSFSMGIGSIESTSEFSHNQKTESQRQHKQISEATRKASEKVRQEREISIEQSRETEFASESTQKIHNPNNEVTVTYLMYELERRYEVSQKLNKVTPVIMVALDMPSPHQITEGWVLEYSWILKRVLLDDMFFDAISIVEEDRLSTEVDIAVKKATYERELRLSHDVQADLDAVLSDRRRTRNEAINLTENKARYEAGEDTSSDVADFIFSGGISELFGGGPDQAELYQASIDAVKSRLKYIEDHAEQLASQQRAAKREAREAGNQYAAAIKDRMQKDVQVKQCLLHIRQNIFHYMHAIWEAKHPDELFFQLAEQMVHHIGPGSVSCTLTPITDPDEIPPGIPGIERRDGIPYRVNCTAPLPPDISELEDLKKPLGQIAYIDNLLGFKGNYAIFPLKDCSYLTDHMMAEFVDDYLGVRDPASDVGVTTAELLEYAKEMIGSDELTDSEKNALTDLVARALSSPSHNTEDIILPTGQIYMEALKGEQALLEDFKLAHRGMDVLKVQEEIRSSRLENLRRAGRMVTEDPDYGDPDVDKIIKISGESDVIIGTGESG